MSEIELEREHLKQQVASLLQRARQGMSEAEALQLESRLLESRVLLLLSQQLSPSATA